MINDYNNYENKKFAFYAFSFEIMLFMLFHVFLAFPILQVKTNHFHIATMGVRGHYDLYAFYALWLH